MPNRDEIKARMSAGDPVGALRLITSWLEAGMDREDRLWVAGQLGAIPRERYTEAGFVGKKVAVLSGYTSQFIVALARVQALRLGLFLEIHETDYGLYEQAVAARDPELIGFKPDLCYFCVGTEHVSKDPVEVEANRWLTLWKGARELLGAEILSNTFEEPLYRVYGNMEPKRADSFLGRVRALNAELAARAPSYVHFHDVNFLAAYHGRKNWRDEALYDLSKVPVAEDHLVDYAESLARLIGSVYGKSRKCLVLDLDNTLWGGVVGDDGVAAIEIGGATAAGEAFARFQAYAKSLKERGVILAVCSKNEHDTAREPFLQRDDMVLRLEDISCFVANWEPKSKNIAHIAKTLEIGTDSMVFFDDNPAEREQVRQAMPEVKVVDVPEEPALYARALSAALPFETVAVTEEDLQRTEQYRANAERAQLAESTRDHGEFLKSLGMRALLAPFDELNIPRITQLINKTNQFNLTTRRYSESDVRAFAKDPSCLARLAKLKDRFGDNGLISVFIGKTTAVDTFEIDTWLMSCRVLKRELEALLFAEVATALKRQGVRWIKGVYIPTAKNKLVENLLSDLGFTADGAAGPKEVRWVFDLQDEPALARVIERSSVIKSVDAPAY